MRDERSCFLFDEKMKSETYFTLITATLKNAPKIYATKNYSIY